MAVVLNKVFLTRLTSVRIFFSLTSAVCDPRQGARFQIRNWKGENHPKSDRHIPKIRGQDVIWVWHRMTWRGWAYVSGSGTWSRQKVHEKRFVKTVWICSLWLQPLTAFWCPEVMWLKDQANIWNTGGQNLRGSFSPKMWNLGGRGSSRSQYPDHELGKWISYRTNEALLNPSCQSPAPPTWLRKTLRLAGNNTAQRSYFAWEICNKMTGYNLKISRKHEVMKKYQIIQVSSINRPSNLMWLKPR